MTSFDGGTVQAHYVIDYSQAARAAQEIRQLYQGIQQQAAQAAQIPQSRAVFPTPDPQAQASIQAYVASLRDMAAGAQQASSPTQELIATIRAQGAALGQTDEQIAAHLAALSREALAADDVARALELQDAALGRSNEQQADGTAKSLRFAQAEAQAAKAAGDYAGAMRILGTELQRQSERSTQVVNAERQLIQLDNQAAAAEERRANAEVRLAQQEARALAIRKDYAGALERLNAVDTTGASARVAAGLETQVATLEKATLSAEGFGAALTSSLTSALGPIALVGTGLGALQSAPELVQLGAQAEQAGAHFDRLARSAGTTGDALIKALRSASHGEISDLNLELAADKAQIEDVAHSAEDFSAIMAVARTRAQEFGVSTGDAFERLVQGIGTLQVRGLKQLGFTINLTDAEAAYARQIGKTVDALTEEEQKQALLQAVLQQAKGDLEGTGTAADTAAGKLQRLGATWENIKARLGVGLADAVLPTTDFVGSTIQALDGTRDSFLRAAQAASVYAGANKEVQQINQDVFKFLLDLAGATDQAAQKARTSAPGFDTQAAAIQANATAADAATPRAYQLASAYDAARAAALATQSPLDQFKANLTQIGVQTELDAQKAGLLAQAQETLAAQTQLVSVQANQAANAFIKLHPGMDATQASALALASGLDPVIAKLIELILKANDANNALAALRQDSVAKSVTAIGKRDISSFGLPTPEQTKQAQDFIASQNQASELAKQEHLAERARQIENIEADLRLAAAHKNTAQQLALLRKEQSLFVAGSNEYKAVQARIIEVENAETKAGRGRISAAQSTGLQLQQVEENTQEQLARIQREGLERLRDQQEDFDVKRARSQEDEDRKIRDLLAHGQRAEAARERERFAIEQRRAQEDFDRERRRTIRNNQEQEGDLTGRADLRTQQIDRRAALRGVQGANVPALSGGAPPPGAAPVPLTGRGAGQQIVLKIDIEPQPITFDGKTIATVIWPTIEQLVDTELAGELGQIGITVPPGAGQVAIAGARP